MDKVHLIEVGPRDGFQNEARVVPTVDKVRIIDRLVDAGLGCIQVTAFVHPEQVPQMADAEALLAALARRPETTFSALVLNRRGFERALATAVDEIEVSASASDDHSRDNTGQGSDRAAAAVAAMIPDGRAAGRRIRAGIQCAFGHRTPGDVPLARVVEMARIFAGAGPRYLALSDTTGVAHPDLVRQTLEAVTAIVPPERLIMHFHDTRGLGLVNVMAALDAGVRRFDTACGGYGGCPAVADAAGNIATEDLAHLLDHLGYPTGIQIPAIAAIARELADIFGHPGTGHLSRLA